MDHSMLQKYFEISYEDVKGACAVEFLSNREWAWDVSIGQSVAKAWPTDMSFQMSPEYPKHFAGDHISNRSRYTGIAVYDFLRRSKC